MIYMVSWKLKSCPRCGGDIFTDRDYYGWYEQCLQCSYLPVQYAKHTEVHEHGEKKEKKELFRQCN